MLMWMVLGMALTVAPQAPAGQPAPEPRAQAEQLARSGSYREALQRFQAIAAANPDDVDARMWIARLHSRMGHQTRALDVFQSILATHPQNVDAMIGAGDALVSLGRYREATEVLNRAEQAAADNAAMLTTQGRLHAAAGRSALALAYYERALSLDPAAVTVQTALEAVRRERAHRIELGYFIEHFNLEDTSDPQAGTGEINYRVSETLRLAGIVQHARKFSQSETRGGAGLEWALPHNIQVHAGALFGGDTSVLPETDGYGGINYTRGRATWSLDLRFAGFESADVRIGGGGLRLALPRGMSAWAKYYRFATDYELASSDIVQSWVLGTAGQPAPRWGLGAEYTRGPDQLEMLTIDRLGAFESNTYSVFTEFLLTPMFSLRGRYDYQDRPADVRMHRATVTLVHRF